MCFCLVWVLNASSNTHRSGDNKHNINKPTIVAIPLRRAGLVFHFTVCIFYAC